MKGIYSSNNSRTWQNKIYNDPRKLCLEEEKDNSLILKGVNKMDAE